MYPRDDTVIINDFTITDVPENCFSGYKYLRRVELHASTRIGKYAFSDCENLEYVFAPKVKTVRGSAFSQCFSLEFINMPNVTRIYDYGFYGCSRLKFIDMPNLTQVGRSSFYNNASLISFVAPRLIRSGTMAFFGCDNLQITKTLCDINTAYIVPPYISPNTQVDSVPFPTSYTTVWR